MGTESQDTRNTSASSETMSQRDKDTADYVREWRIWAGVTVIVAIVWGIMSMRAGHLIMAWPPLAVMGIWAAVLVALPLFPSSDKS